MPHARTIRNLLVPTLLLVTATAAAGPFSDYFILGDSQSDAGNNALLTDQRSVAPYDPVAFYPYTSGTYSNGPIWADYFAGRFFKRPAPSLAGGTNFAFGGARITDDNSPVPIDERTPNLFQQTAALSAYYNSLPSRALYMLWGGANDTFDAMRYFLDDPNESGRRETAEGRINEALDAYGLIISTLAAGGAEHMLVLNLGDGGLAPLYSNAPETIDGLNVATYFTGYFNDGLSALLDDLVDSFPDLDLASFDVFGFITSIVNNPGDYGLANATDSCIVPNTETSPVCANPDEYLFWDGVHTTTAANAMLADAIYEAVPVPATPLLVLAGLLALLQRRRRAAA